MVNWFINQINTSIEEAGKPKTKVIDVGSQTFIDGINESILRYSDPNNTDRKKNLRN